MNREQARKNWEVIKAYGEGKELQYRKVGETEWHDERKHLGFCFDTDDCEFRIKPEENHTIEQNCGENRIEGGVLSVSGSVSEPWYVIEDDGEYYVRTYIGTTGKGFEKVMCRGTMEECLKWKEEHEKKHYRPFNNCDELIEHWCDVILGIFKAEEYRPNIWVKHKHYGVENLITAFDNDNESIGGSCVFIQDMWCDMAELFEQYTFLDGSPCGVEE